MKRTTKPKTIVPVPVVTPTPEPSKPVTATFADVKSGDKLRWWDMTVNVVGKDQGVVTIMHPDTGRSKSLYAGEFDAQGYEKVAEGATV